MATILRLHPRLAGLIVLAAAGVTLPVAAQTATVGVAVQASVKGASIWVDNVEYKSAASFSWEVGSRHTLDVRVRYQGLSDGSRLTFQGWQVSGTNQIPDPAGLVQVITADAATPSYTALFGVERKVTVQIDYDPLRNLFDPTAINLRPFNPDELPLAANQNGYVVVPGQNGCGSRLGIPTSTWFWIQDSSQITLTAIPYPGRVFSGWFVPPGPVSNPGAILVDRPLTLWARFATGRRFYLDSAPVKGLTVLVDRQQYRTRGDKCWKDFSNFFSPGGTAPPPEIVPPNNPPPPSSFNPMPASSYCTQILLCDGEVDLEPGTQHVFAAPPVQQDANGNRWVFDHWNFGGDENGGQNSVISVPTTATAYYYTAHFVKGILVNFFTQPGNLKLNIDGRSNWAHYSFYWGVGHQHRVSAPVEQIDAKGRRYRFVGWSNEGPADQEITIAEPAEHPEFFGLTAKYELLGQVKLNGEVSALTFTVDGTECRAPCTLDRPQGTQAAVTVQAETEISPDMKAVFDGWSDGVSTPERTVEFTENAQLLTARFHILYRLTTRSDPEEGAKWTLDPVPDAGGWFTAGTPVTVTVEANRGFKFRRFEGALTGTYPTGWITMNAPATVAAHFDRVPALQEGAVRNAAGETPVEAVAPGSLISILGVNMVYSEETGPSNPLTQTLQGIAIQIDDRILPLVSVSPAEIVALLPSDMEPGEYTLRFRPPDQPLLTGKFTVVRNAPGLFHQPDSPPEAPFALAFHEDGQVVNIENPAEVGETVTLLGTGFGPVDPLPLDGFAVPEAPPMAVVDPLELIIGDDVRPHIWAGAAPGRVGYDLLRFKIDATMGEAQNLRVSVKVNGQASNTVLLPVQ